MGSLAAWKWIPGEASPHRSCNPWVFCRASTHSMLSSSASGQGEDFRRIFIQQHSLHQDYRETRLCQGRLRLEIRENIFTRGAVKHWNRVSGKCGGSETQADVAPFDMISGHPGLGWRLDWMILEVLSNLNDFVSWTLNHSRSKHSEQQHKLHVQPVPSAQHSTGRICAWFNLVLPFARWKNPLQYAWTPLLQVTCVKKKTKQKQTTKTY